MHNIALQVQFTLIPSVSPKPQSQQIKCCETKTNTHVARTLLTRYIYMGGGRKNSTWGDTFMDVNRLVLVEPHVYFKAPQFFIFFKTCSLTD